MRRHILRLFRVFWCVSGRCFRERAKDRHATLRRMQRNRKILASRLARVVIACMACAIWCFAQSSRSGARLQTRATLERHLKSFSQSNDEREKLIKKWLADAGCADANLHEQAIGGPLPPNVICVLPGETQETIVIGAHTDKVNMGDGVVDNWTGALLLPGLLYSLNTQPRRHTIIFVGFSAEEQGLLGSKYYVNHLTRDQRAHIDGMVNFDSLGLGPTKVWASHADQPLLDDLRAIAASTHLPLATENVDSIGASADAESFARDHIPRITLHSVTDETWSILHSPSDKLAAVRMSDYYNSYKLIAQYLAYLDHTLKAPKPRGSGTPTQ